MSTATQLKVPYVQLGAQHADIKGAILDRISALLDSGEFILGSEVAAFEKSFAELCGTKYALGVANGTDALFLSMMSLGIGAGDEVITAPNSYLASASSIALAGARPVFADVLDDFNLDPAAVRKAVTPRTKAIIAVHLTGRPARMKELLAIAAEHKLHVLEDCAQAIGATLNGQHVGSFGIAGCFSLHPLKNLAAAGDGGVITTSDDALYARLLKARNHGLRDRDNCEFFSYNSRLDNLQAAILNIKLSKLAGWTERRRAIAATYQERLAGVGDLIVPKDQGGEWAVYHTFIIQTAQRDALKQYLMDHGIDTKVHYPVPIHLQQAAAYLGCKRGDFPVTERQCTSILSLPVFAELNDEQVGHVADTIVAFFNK
ncbi:MAG TPA: DegT/DnrJ/EryC1/StrS family aminotransferase [Flavobacteriales bacterium]|nr:DegT/DnrJ/EryC1/StrS family aminotransferase [Flavobacteriales bacterium]